MLAPTCVAGGSSDNWLTGCIACFLQEDDRRLRLKIINKMERRVFIVQGLLIVDINVNIVFRLKKYF